MTPHLKRIMDLEAEAYGNEYFLNKDYYNPNTHKAGFQSACDILLPLIEEIGTMLIRHSSLGNHPVDVQFDSREALSKIKQTLEGE